MRQIGALVDAGDVRKSALPAKPTENDVKQLVGCDKQRAGTPIHRHGVPALALVTPYKFTNWPVVGQSNYCAAAGGFTVIVIGWLGSDTSVFGRSVAAASLLNGT